MTARRLYAVEWVAGQSWALPEYGEYRTRGLVSAWILRGRLRGKHPGVGWRIVRDYTRLWESV